MKLVVTYPLSIAIKAVQHAATVIPQKNLALSTQILIHLIHNCNKVDKCQKMLSSMHHIYLHLTNFKIPNTPWKHYSRADTNLYSQMTLQCFETAAWVTGWASGPTWRNTKREVHTKTKINSSSSSNNSSKITLKQTICRSQAESRSRSESREPWSPSRSWSTRRLFCGSSQPRLLFSLDCRSTATLLLKTTLAVSAWWTTTVPQHLECISSIFIVDNSMVRSTLHKNHNDVAVCL